MWIILTVSGWTLQCKSCVHETSLLRETSRKSEASHWMSSNTRVSKVMWINCSLSYWFFKLYPESLHWVDFTHSFSRERLWRSRSWERKQRREGGGAQRTPAGQEPGAVQVGGAAPEMKMPPLVWGSLGGCGLLEQVLFFIFFNFDEHRSHWEYPILENPPNPIGLGWNSQICNDSRHPSADAKTPAGNIRPEGSGHLKCGRCCVHQSPECWLQAGSSLTHPTDPKLHSITEHRLPRVPPEPGQEPLTRGTALTRARSPGSIYFFTSIIEITCRSPDLMVSLINLTVGFCKVDSRLGSTESQPLFVVFQP